MIALIIFPFLDGLRAKFSALFHFYGTIGRLIGIALPLWIGGIWAVMGEVRLEYLVLAMCDSRLIPSAVRYRGIPPYIQQVVNGESMLLCLGMSVLLGPKWVLVAVGTGLVLGNFFRHGMASYFAFHKVWGFWISLGLSLYVIGMHFDEILWSFMPWSLLLIALRYGAVFIALLGSKLQWSTHLFLGSVAAPGALAFALMADNPFILTTLALSLIIHSLLLYPLSRWYGKIFTGPDTASPLPEHIPTIPLPI